MSSSVKEIKEWIRTLVIAAILTLGVHTYVAEARWIPSESMLPTLHVGDYLLVEKLSIKTSGIQHGDIIVFNAPPASERKDVLIKRVIGLPGDNIAIKQGTVYINGAPLNEPYILEKAEHDFKPFTVPENSVFVMGDNRNNSYDSRFYGTVPVSNVIGKAIVRYYPFDKVTKF